MSTISLERTYWKWLFVLFIFGSCFQQVNAQDTTSLFERRISISLKNIPVYRALFEISEKIDYNFSYNSDILDGERRTSLEFQQEKLGTIIDSLLQDTTLQFDTYNNHIIIYRQDRKPTGARLALLKRLKKDTLVKIQGRIIDKTDKEPLSYCNIGLMGKAKGTISNINGEFLLKINASAVGDSVIFTYLGYNNKIMPVEELLEKNTVLMEKKSYSIQEVIVKWSDPYSVVMEATSRIKENYFREPIMLTSFYRESVKREDEYTSISEAVMKIYKPYSKVFRSDQIKILKSRKNVNYAKQKQDNVLLKLKSGLEALSFLDIIDQNFSFLNPVQLKNYQFEFKGITYFNNHDTYEISFKPDKNVDFPLYSGTIFIDVKTLAIVSAEFYLDDTNLNKISNSLIIKKKWDLKVKPKQAKYTVNYRQLGRRYYLNHIRGDLVFKVRKKNEFIAENYQVSFEMITSDVDTAGVSHFEYSEITKPHKIFIEEIRGYDEEFWGQYNYILPEEPLRKTLDKMNAQIKMLQEN